MEPVTALLPVCLIRAAGHSAPLQSSDTFSDATLQRLPTQHCRNGLYVRFLNVH